MFPEEVVSRFIYDDWQRSILMVENVPLGLIEFAYQKNSRMVYATTGVNGDRRWRLNARYVIANRRLRILMSTILPAIGVGVYDIARMLDCTREQVRYSLNPRTSLQFNYEVDRGLLVEGQVLVKPDEAIEEGAFRNLVETVLPSFGMTMGSDGKIVSALTEISPLENSRLEMREIQGIKVKGFPEDLDWLVENLEYTRNLASQNVMVVYPYGREPFSLLSGQCMAYLRNHLGLSVSTYETGAEAIQFVYDPKKRKVTAAKYNRRNIPFFSRKTTRSVEDDDFMVAVLTYVLPQLGVPEEEQISMLGTVGIFVPGDGKVRITADESGTVFVHVGEIQVWQTTPSDKIPKTLSPMITRMLRQQGYAQNNFKIVKSVGKKK